MGSKVVQNLNYFSLIHVTYLKSHLCFAGHLDQTHMPVLVLVESSEQLRVFGVFLEIMLCYLRKHSTLVDKKFCSYRSYAARFIGNFAYFSKLFITYCDILIFKLPQKVLGKDCA